MCPVAKLTCSSHDGCDIGHRDQDPHFLRQNVIEREFSTRWKESPMIYDLSHPLGPGMPSYPGLPVPKFHTFLAHGDAAQHAHYTPGTTFQIAAYELGGNT